MEIRFSKMLYMEIRFSKMLLYGDIMFLVKCSIWRYVLVKCSYMEIFHNSRGHNRPHFTESQCNVTYIATEDLCKMVMLRECKIVYPCFVLQVN